jgi:cytochrome c oxidase subunit 3
MSTSVHSELPETTSHGRHDYLHLNRLGLWLFLLSESMIFLILLTTRFFLLGASRPEELNQGLALALTVILLVSSLTAYLAETSIAHGDREGFLRYLLLTMVLGTLFLVGVVGFEWQEAPHMGIVPQSGYGIAFFSMTGMHALHVLSGIVLLGIIYLNGRRGGYAPGKYWGVEASVKYWHFVDLVWVFFYPVLYLIG